MIFNYQNFDGVFGFELECSYDEVAIRRATVHRQALEGLFVDRVLKLLGIKRPVKYYPPKTNGDLRNLHKAVVDSAGADHHKLSVLFYILLDFDAPTGRRDYSTAFERRSFLPQKYQIYMKGLWHMDQLEFEAALQYLTHPSVIPTFQDEIIDILVNHSKDNNMSLALAYYHTVQPTLTSSSALGSLFSAIAKTSITEAFYFTRTQTEHAQRHMFEKLIALVLNNSPQDTVADRSVELIGLPLNREEEVWFNEYLLHGEGRAIRKAKDTVMMRRIGTGNFVDSLAFDGMNTRPIGGLDWATLSSAVQDGLGPRLHV